MIREIIVSNTVSGIFLIFCRSSFTNNFIVENNFSTLKSPTLIFRNISRTIYLKKFPHTVLNIISAQISCKNFFRNNFSSRKWSFFRDYKTTDLNICFINLFRKTVKNWWFCSFKWAIRTLHATLRYYIISQAEARGNKTLCNPLAEVQNPRSSCYFM